MTERTNSRKYARVNVTEKELAQIDEIAECLGYTNRTELYTACMTARQIAAVLGCSKTSVETAMKHHGLKRALVLPKGNT